ncbi:hypothetical protein NE237_000144 [Protea cynaroides]|uniref:Protein kinase domain-containing protein n=1 Tax=Protea cynaroides TaxID=273540 RepID=A0A9Q0GKJ0_9MAGN|nr:hypothetical protein NE237_000144 [Protea cynaroides]
MKKKKINVVTDKLSWKKKKIEEDYDLDYVIGEGAYGSVRLCRCKTSGAEYACKTLSKKDKNVHQEVEIMKHLSGHPGVVNLEGVVQRDIKPDNILLTSSRKMKLGDFDLAIRFSNGQRLSSQVGTLPYCAPEVLLGDYSNKVDIWSAGVVLHGLLVGTNPFDREISEEISEAIEKEQLDFHSGDWRLISGPARDLMSRMLNRDVSARITTDEPHSSGQQLCPASSADCPVQLTSEDSSHPAQHVYSRRRHSPFPRVGLLKKISQSSPVASLPVASSDSGSLSQALLATLKFLIPLKDLCRALN